MTLSPIAAEWAAAYEREHGRRPADLVLQIEEHILKVGKMLTELDQKDAQEGKAAYPTEEFSKLVRKVFRNIPGGSTTEEIAELWQSDYMDGYNS